MPSSAVLSCQTGDVSPAKACPRQEANREHRARAAKGDARTRMLLENPIAPTILRLAVPNATVMTGQTLIGLLGGYFVSLTGVHGLAGVTAVFPLVSLSLTIAQA